MAIGVTWEWMFPGRDEQLRKKADEFISDNAVASQKEKRGGGKSNSYKRGLNRLYHSQYVILEYATADAMFRSVRAMSMTVYLDSDVMGWDQPYPKGDRNLGGGAMLLKKSLSDPGVSMYLTVRCNWEHDESECDTADFKSRRYSKDLVRAYSETLDHLRFSGIEKYNLVAFGSGAAIALALAGQRNDIASVVTFSGDTDPVARARANGETLVDLEDPLAYTERLKTIPQRHYVEDAHEDPSSRLLDSYLAKVGGPMVSVCREPARWFFSWEGIAKERFMGLDPSCR
jgi:pimeloyl-ACP methyl ester carboxylesterase